MPEARPEDLLESYDYALPDELIAQKPIEPRDRARLLVLDRARGSWSHRVFRELPEILSEHDRANDLIVANNTQVLKARLIGKRLTQPGDPGWNEGAREGGRVEVVLLEELRPRVWEGLFHASAKHRAGLQFVIPTPDGRGLKGTLIRSSWESPHGNVVAEFDRDPVESGAGELPLPKYIRRASGEDDTHDYQTVYARHLGSAAAPTAGLHFTPTVLASLKETGIDWREVTLHVGLGTFRPVKENDVRKHLMHEEKYEISPEVAESVTSAKRSGRKIVAVGTTSVRTLESAWDPERGLGAGAGRTSLFIRPGAFQFRVVDRMLTNFHLPKSTLLMLVSAFAGRELTLAAYNEAVRERYRFFSYGDAMLIL